MDAGPWLPQPVQVEDEASDYYFGRGQREVGDVEMMEQSLGGRDLPRVNAARYGRIFEEEDEGAVSPKDPTGSTAPMKPQPKSALLALTNQPHSSSQPSAPRRTPTVVQPRPGYGPVSGPHNWNPPAASWTTHWWEEDEWGSWEGTTWWGQRGWGWWEETQWWS